MLYAKPLLVAALLLGVFAPLAHAGDDWAGEWVTDEGAMTLTQDGRTVTGRYGKGATLEGKAKGRELEGTYQVGNVRGRFEFALEKGALHFTGKWIHPSGNSGTWRGWKPDAEARDAKRADFGGYWLTSIGTLRLTQKGKKAEGPWRHRGWSTFEGEVQGRRLEGTLTHPRWRGSVWLELTEDGDRLFGLTDENPPAAVRGVRVEGFEEDPKLKAGEIAKGIAENGMLYFIRPPSGWKKGKKVDAIVLLHGSNWTTAGMVAVTAKRWPRLGKEMMIVGIQGDTWAATSEPPDLRFNYHYVNWMGKSTYKGYPFTERDSPQVVADVVSELAAAHDWKRTFVGGHSQGGFLTYLLVMHFPERFAGAFPVAGGMVMQAEPDVFEDEDLKQAQRDTPIAIVHGRQDGVVDFDTGLYIRDRYEGEAFPLVTLLDPELGHPYDFLPIGDAVDWLDAMSTEDPESLAAFADDAAKAKRWRDVGCALVRAKALRCEGKLDAAVAKLDQAAGRKADTYRRKLEAGEGGDWVDAFFDWKRQFAYAPAAAKTMEAYARLEAEHGPRAEALVDEAGSAFRRGDRAAGRAKWEEVVETCFASGRYPMVKRWLANAR